MGVQTKNMNKLSVHLVTWNGAKYIPYLFDSLRKQTFKDWKLIILDNASSDETAKQIKKELENFDIEYEFLEEKENTGFAGGHNFLYSKLKNTEYFLLLNQDMYLNPDCLGKMVDYLDENKDVASVSPRLMRWDFNLDIENSFSDYVDALGMKVFRNRRIIEQYTQQNWEEIKNNFADNNVLEVFGVSGAFPMYRCSVIDKIGFLDSSYHSYKEDVDLAFRLRSRGCKSCVLLDVIAYHDRAGAGPREMGDKYAVKNKKLQSSWVKYHSYKNHLATLYKNEYWQNCLFDWPWIKWYEMKKFIWFLIFDRSVLKGLAEIWKNRKYLKAEKLKIKSLRKVDWREIRKWWS